jgi:MYXO-CTERM domain-containing protein
MVVARNVTVAAGGVLDLKGCTLAMDSPPYVDQVFAHTDEGLVITVLQGGELRLEATPGHPAAIERADPRYGYTIKAFGNVSSVGLPDAHNRISGLEGAHQPQLALGGFQVRAGASFSYTDFTGNSGPGVFALGGVELRGDHLTFTNGSGFLVSRADEVVLSDVDVNGTYGGGSISATPRVTIERCTMRGFYSAFYLALSNATVSGCSFDSPGTAVQAENANLTLKDSSVRYGQRGIQDGYRSKFKSYTNRVALDHVTIEGTNANATSAVLAAGAVVDIQHSTLSAVQGPVVNATSVEFTLLDSSVKGPSLVKVSDPLLLRVERNTWDGAHPAVTVSRTTLVHVEDKNGQPLANATLTLRSGHAKTGATGQALLVWPWFEADEVRSLVDHKGTVPLSVTDPRTGKTVTKQMDATLTQVRVTLGDSKLAPGPGPAALALAALAAAVAVRRRR